MIALIIFQQGIDRNECKKELHHTKTNILDNEKIKAQISFPVTVKQICAFALFSLHNHSTFLIQNFQPLAIFNACTAQFVSDLFLIHIVGFLMMRFI